MSGDSVSRRFSRMDLLIAAGIILMLTAVAIPFIQSAREAARRMSCENNLKQIGLGLLNYHETFKCLPAGWLSAHPADPSGAESWAWSVPILPFTN